VLVKRDGRLRLVGRGKEEYNGWLAGIAEGLHFTVEFKHLSASKSQEQLGYYYGVVLPDILDGLIELGWSEIGYDDFHGLRIPKPMITANLDEFLKARYSAGKKLETVVSKARFTKKEMSEFLEWVLNFAQENSIAVHPAEKEATWAL